MSCGLLECWPGTEELFLVFAAMDVVAPIGVFEDDHVLVDGPFGEDRERDAVVDTPGDDVALIDDHLAVTLYMRHLRNRVGLRGHDALMQSLDFPLLTGLGQLFPQGAQLCAKFFTHVVILHFGLFSVALFQPQKKLEK
jgi:hypothetical protein